MSKLQFDEQEIVLESDMGNDPLSLKDHDMYDVAKVLATHMLSGNTTTKESDEAELAWNQDGFWTECGGIQPRLQCKCLWGFSDENDGTIPSNQVQNVQANILHEQSIPYVDHMSANPGTSEYVKRHLYQKAEKTKKKRKLLMIKLLQKVFLIDAWTSPSRRESISKKEKHALFIESQSEGYHRIRYTFICTIINMMIECIKFCHV